MIRQTVAESVPKKEKKKYFCSPRIEGPWCPLCAERNGCESAVRFAAYPHCWQPLREADSCRTRNLFAWLRGQAGIGPDERLLFCLDVIFNHLDCHGRNFSEVFEPSLSFDGRRWNALRFSYAFPAARHQPSDTAAAISRFLKPFCENHTSIGKAFLRQLENPVVLQPLVGLAYNAPEHWRLKLYLQFEDFSESDKTSKLCRRLLSITLPRQLAKNRHLHMVGIDLGKRGVMEVKLYYRPAPPPSPDAKLLRSSTLLRRLLPPNFSNWKDFLFIHRLCRPEDANIAHLAKIDFSLAPNGFHADAVLRDSLLAARLASGPWNELHLEFPVVPRRLSLTPGRLDRIIIYYVLGADRKMKKEGVLCHAASC